MNAAIANALVPGRVSLCTSYLDHDRLVTLRQVFFRHGYELPLTVRPMKRWEERSYRALATRWAKEELESKREEMNAWARKTVEKLGDVRALLARGTRTGSNGDADLWETELSVIKFAEEATKAQAAALFLDALIRHREETAHDTRGRRRELLSRQQQRQ